MYLSVKVHYFYTHIIYIDRFMYSIYYMFIYISSSVNVYLKERSERNDTENEMEVNLGDVRIHFLRSQYNIPVIFLRFFLLLNARNDGYDIMAYNFKITFLLIIERILFCFLWIRASECVYFTI